MNRFCRSVSCILFLLLVLCSMQATYATADDTSLSEMRTLPLRLTTQPAARVTTYADVGQAQFLPPVSGDTTQNVQFIADINGDGSPDILAFTFGTLLIQFNNGAGIMSPTQSATIPADRGVVAVADFTGDGKADILLNDLTLLTNRYPQTPMFTATTHIDLSQLRINGIDHWAAADINGDGRRDVVVTSSVYGGDTSNVGLILIVCLNQGGGVFAPPKASYSRDLVDTARSLAFGDLNRDGKMDITFTTSDTTAIAYGNGDGSFSTLVTAPGGTGLRDTHEVADINHDSYLDMLISHTSTDFVVYWGKADNDFRAETFTPTNGITPETLHLADLNHDGFLDVVYNRYLSTDVNTFMNINGTTLVQRRVEANDTIACRSQLVADMDGDGFPDLISAKETVGKFTNICFNGTSMPPAAHPYFLALWAWSDKVVAENKVQQRSYLWGPQSVYAGFEPYHPAYPEGGYYSRVDGLRAVQYFDKGRMEEPRSLPGGLPPTLVTSGLLVKELVTGRQQDGDDVNMYTQGKPSEVQIAGDPNTGGQNAISPTYRSFKDSATFNGDHPVAPQIGQVVNQRIAKDGTISPFAPPVTTHYATYDDRTCHNVADVFVAFMATQGITYSPATGYTTRSIFAPDATSVIGLPITDPYWTRAVVAGKETDVLVQLFERRVLTYEPGAPPAYQVQMGNVGQHYYRWRYKENLGR